MGRFFHFCFASGLFVFALACGGGGGSGSSNSQSTQHLRTKIQPASLFNILPGTTFTIQTLSGEREDLLSETELTGEDLQSFELSFRFDENYLFKVNRYGVPFLRTVLLGSQIEKASENGILNIGEVNAITTFFADISSGSSSLAKAQRGKSESELRSAIAEYFNINSSFDFSQLSFSNINEGTLPTTLNFDAVANRINLLLFYIGTVTDLTATPTQTQRNALGQLYNGVLNTNLSVTQLSTLLDTPDLPKSSDGGTDLMNRIVRGGYAIQTENSLPLSDILSIFNDPVANVTLLQEAVALATSQIAGSIGGYRLEGIELAIQKEDGTLVKSTSTLNDGSYKLKGLEAGQYEIKPQLDGFVFRPALFKVELNANQRLKGFDFTSFMYINGSFNIPAPEKVLQGVTYTDIDGSTELQGSFTMLSPDASQVLEGVFYGDEQGLAYSGNVSLPNEDEVLAGVNYGPGASKIGTAQVQNIQRQAATGQATSSKFRVSYY